jgi:hypothetical protein
VDWSLTTECTPPDQETSERRPYAPQGATGVNYTVTNWVVSLPYYVSYLTHINNPLPSEEHDIVILKNNGVVRLVRQASVDTQCIVTRRLSTKALTNRH